MQNISARFAGKFYVWLLQTAEEVMAPVSINQEETNQQGEGAIFLQFSLLSPAGKHNFTGREKHKLRREGARSHYRRKRLVARESVAS